MIGQTLGTLNQKSDLREGRTQLGENTQKLSEAFTKREPLVKQSQELKKKLNEMIMDILILAKTDEDAKTIVAKYNIQQNLPASGDGAAAPAPGK